MAADPEGSFCHLDGWRTIMEDVLGHQTHYLEERAADGALSGILPLVRVRSRIFGDYLLSMPFLNYGGPLGDAPARAALSAQAIDMARALNVDLLELRTRHSPAPGLIPAGRKLAVVMPLPATADALWEKGFRSKLRSQIRRPINEGMDVRFGPDQREAFYEVFSRNMRDLGTPVLPQRWFESIARSFSDIVVFATIYWRDIPVAAGCGFLWDGEFEITWASSLREHNPRSPNMLLYWSLMQEAIRRGATSFNFGRSTPGASTHRFKQQWGGQDEPLPWSVWGARTAPPNPDSAKYRLARNVWSRLPVTLARRIGPVLARQLP